MNKPDPGKSVNLAIDGLPLTVPEGTTILEAARKVNVKIPTLCDHPDLCRRAVCRLCVVEADGRGKLLAACANDVWEGVSVVTNNARILNIRRTIVELILASHPRECLNCARNKNCELQTLAADFGIRSSPFSREDAPDHAANRGSLNLGSSNRPKAETAAETLVRDMDKCVKCGRCVEACQEVQAVRAINSAHRGVQYEISTAYNRSLSDSPCVFCGQCAEVCPVGAIYEHDQTGEVWAALSGGDGTAAVQVAPSAAAALDGEFGYPPGTVTSGKIVSALELMGFKFVYNALDFADMTNAQQDREIRERIKTSFKPPMISVCSAGGIKFIEEFYPDLLDRLSVSKTPEQNFKAYWQSPGQRSGEMTFVSVMPCAAKKFLYRPAERDNAHNNEIVLTSREFARMLRLAGINLRDLPEGSFVPLSKTARLDPPEAKRKTLVVNGLADARRVLDSVREGGCDAELVKIMCCPGGCTMENGTIKQ